MRHPLTLSDADAEINRLRDAMRSAIDVMIATSERNQTIRGQKDSITRQLLRDGIKAARAALED